MKWTISSQNWVSTPQSAPRPPEEEACLLVQEGVSPLDLVEASLLVLEEASPAAPEEVSQVDQDVGLRLLRVLVARGRWRLTHQMEGPSSTQDLHVLTVTR